MTFAQSIWHGFVHTGLTIVAFGVPVLLMQNFSWESLTIGGALGMVANAARAYLSAPAQQ